MNDPYLPPKSAKKKRNIENRRVYPNSFGKTSWQQSSERSSTGKQVDGEEIQRGVPVRGAREGEAVKTPSFLLPPLLAW